MFGHILKDCNICHGIGCIQNPSGPTGPDGLINCPWCKGAGCGNWGDLDALGASVSDIRVIIDKMSSNLDDIMVKLDV